MDLTGLGVQNRDALVPELVARRRDIGRPKAHGDAEYSQAQDGEQNIGDFLIHVVTVAQVRLLRQSHFSNGHSIPRLPTLPMSGQIARAHAPKPPSASCHAL